MRVRLPSIAFVLLCLPLGSLGLVAACGDDSNPADAGPDATTEGGKDVAKLETGPDVLDASCANDVDLTQYLPSADASIDVDAGGVDLVACGACFKTDCSGQINTCNQSCDCRQGVIDFVTCVGSGSQLNTCVSEALASGNNDLISLIGCAANNCVAVCLPGDGGTGSDASDGSTDAADDGG